MFARHKMLVVEDNQFVRALVVDMLTKEGFEVEAAGDARDAMDKAKSFQPDGAILDIELGSGPTGFDLSKVLREQNPDIGLVFLTNIPEPRTVGVDNRTVPRDAAYVVKEALGDVKTLLQAVSASLRGRISPALRHDKNQHALSDLSRSQLELLHLAALGHSNQEIATRRKTTIRAVENLFKRAVEASGVEVNPGDHGRVQAVRLYIETVGMPKRSAEAK